MISRLVLAFASLLIAGSAAAQSVSGLSSTQENPTMKQLLDDGYEIKAAVPNGSKFVVFMQKDQSAFACEFVNLTQTRCGAIN
ncbi:hypothetical protein [Rhizobium sp. L1K21]|uniref:hypothetical protein n=1 Tax=Rhizobium sp. L1K21 TaxID=2954933 RepID=UPI002092C822|nr:hypothetical protein [Rhizobium sp. L1K21]MCO6186104.1 hypothetical protein [Rhizobium sp. L1K21]